MELLAKHNYNGQHWVDQFFIFPKRVWIFFMLQNHFAHLKSKIIAVAIIDTGQVGRAHSDMSTD